MKIRLLISALLAMLLPLEARANCATEQTLCEAGCSVQHFADKAARLGCESRCVAERAACSTEAGARKALEVGKQAWRDTGAFVDGFIQQDDER